MKKLINTLSALALGLSSQTTFAISQSCAAEFLSPVETSKELLNPVDIETATIWIRSVLSDLTKVSAQAFATNQFFRFFVESHGYTWSKLSSTHQDILFTQFISEQLFYWQQVSPQQRVNLKNRELMRMGLKQPGNSSFAPEINLTTQSQQNRRLIENALRKQFAPSAEVRRSTLAKIEEALSGLSFRFAYALPSGQGVNKKIPLINDFYIANQQIAQPLHIRSFLSELLENSSSVGFTILTSVDADKASKSMFPHNIDASLELVDLSLATQFGFVLPAINNQTEILKLRMITNPQADIEFATENKAFFSTDSSKFWNQYRTLVLSDHLLIDRKNGRVLRAISEQLQDLVLTTEDAMELIRSMVRIYLIHEASWDTSAVLSRLSSWESNPHLSQSYIFSTIFKEMGFPRGFSLRIPGNVGLESMRFHQED